MPASFHGEQQPIERLFHTAFRGEIAPPAMSLPQVSADSILADARADVDISDGDFDFVRSARVFEIIYRQSCGSDGDCNSWGTLYMSSYNKQVEYSRRRSNISAVQDASDLGVPTSCGSYWQRSVFVERKDYEGAYCHAEVHD